MDCLMSKKIFFLHRSVGDNLIIDGNLHELLKSKDIEFSDFNQNTQILRDSGGSRKTNLQMPGSDTHPKNYAELFSDENSSELLYLALSFDFVLIKSCYPNSNIKSDDELRQIKQYYQSIFDFFKSRRKKLVLLTSPPLRPTSTSKENAARAKQLASWLTNANFGSSISIFDFFNLLSDNDGYLKKEYRRLIWLDNHPNKKASENITPKLLHSLT